MNITIQSKSGIPIYEQITKQLREAITNGELKAGEPLPSIRGLAAELAISVITTKRAYEDLEKEGMVYSVPGKGFFVDDPDLDFLAEKQTLGLEDSLAKWVMDAKKAGLSKREAMDMLEILFESVAF